MDSKRSTIDINISSFNTHGFKSNALFVNNLIKHNDIIFLSEHWLSSLEKFQAVINLHKVADQCQQANNTIPFHLW